MEMQSEYHMCTDCIHFHHTFPTPFHLPAFHSNTMFHISLHCLNTVYFLPALQSVPPDHQMQLDHQPFLLSVLPDQTPPSVPPVLLLPDQAPSSVLPVFLFPDQAPSSALSVPLLPEQAPSSALPVSLLPDQAPSPVLVHQLFHRQLPLFHQSLPPVPDSHPEQPSTLMLPLLLPHLLPQADCLLP